MQRRLIAMRHAKSAWDTDAASDHQRPLNKRGLREAPITADRLRETGWIPERVLCSDAVRARQTWELMKPALGTDPPVTFLRDLYLCGRDAVAGALAPLADTVSTAMIIGHNPGWEEVVALLTGKPQPLATANAALLATDADSWADAVRREGGWRLVDVVRPRD